MTRTEGRLGDALRASAGRVRDDRLRPLPELEPETGPRATQRGWLPGAWRSWLGPAAAAVSVALVIGLALAVTSASGRLAGGAHASRSRVASGAVSIPWYFAQFGVSSPVGTSVGIRSVATGSVVATAPSPRRAGWSVQPDAMAAAPDGRTFYVAYHAYRPGRSPVAQIWVYRLSPAGGLTMVKGGVIPGGGYTGLRGAMAVSPGGIRLALTVPQPRDAASGHGASDKIVVVNLGTGGHTTWEGGLDHGTETFSIPDLSWRADGKSIVFLGLWCATNLTPVGCESASGQAASRGEEVRAIPVASGGGSLARGAVLLSPGSGGPVITDAIAAPQPGELTLVVLSGRAGTVGPWPVATVERVDARTRSVLGVDYRLATGRGGEPSDIELGSDSSGQNLILSYGGRAGFRAGWVHGGLFRPLPIRQPYLGYPITAW